jgi:4-hydroxybenzoate polyprenyltransferase
MTQNVSSMAVPLVVDLDGTLTPTDTLVESLVLLVRSNPVYLLLIPFWLLFGRAGFKQRVADRVLPDVEALPLRAGLVDYLRAQRATGRRLVLATAADGRIAHRVAARLGLFDEVLASEAGHNLKGTNKLAAIRARVGERFVYAGDTQADLPIWRAATAAIPVGVASSLRAKLVAESISVEREFPAEAAGWRDWLRALRVHQWLKNVLIFVPILTAFVFSDPARVQAAVFAFIAFSLMASATYIVNDLWDLDNDRRHPRKCQRPFAAARLPIGQGVAAAAGLLLAALVPALQLSPIFVALLLLYLLMTSAYSWVLKRYVLIDVVMLASLYTLRIVAGAAAAHVVVSVWLLAFSVFVFMSLALVKRCAELVTVMQNGAEAVSGRDYRAVDLAVLWPFGVGAGLCAVVVFALFVNAPETAQRYGAPQLLWFAAIGLLYWLGRLWVKTARGEMHDDPLVYAVRDIGSRATVAFIVAIVLAAHFAHLPV